MKKLTALLLIVVLAFGALAGFLYSQREELISRRIRDGIKSLTGTDVALEHVAVRKLKGSGDWVIEIRKMMIKNPENFEIPNMALATNVKIIFDPFAFLTGQWKIRRLYVHLQKGNFQVNKAGVFNISSMPAMKAVSSGAPAKPVSGFWADRIEIKYWKLYHLDYSANPPQREVISLKGKLEVFDGINDPALLVQAPVFTYLTELNQGSLGLPKGKLQEAIKAHLKSSTVPPPAAS